MAHLQGPCVARVGFYLKPEPLLDLRFHFGLRAWRHETGFTDIGHQARIARSGRLSRILESLRVLRSRRQLDAGLSRSLAGKWLELRLRRACHDGPAGCEGSNESHNATFHLKVSWRFFEYPSGPSLATSALRRKVVPRTGGFRGHAQKACGKAGIIGLTFYDLRGSAVTRLGHRRLHRSRDRRHHRPQPQGVEDILDKHYLSRDQVLAETGIRKLERRTKSANRGGG